MMLRYLKKIVLILIFFPVMILEAQQPGLVKGWEVRMGLGYIHTGPEMDRIWTDGFAWEMLTVGYKPFTFFGFETGFILGLTGMQDKLKRTVDVYYRSTGETGTQKSTGGGWGGFPFGGRFCFKLFTLPVVIGFGGGGIYGWEEESGITADGYHTRMTSGLGYYLLGSAHIMSSSINNPGGIGIQVRYVSGTADISDFNSSFMTFTSDGTPILLNSLKEGRWIITLDFYFDFKGK
jgi:hypothetical protein